MCMNKKYLYILLIVAIIVVGGFWYQQKNGENYEMHVVSQESVIQNLSLIGAVEPIDRLELGFERSGRVEQVFVKKNAVITPGEVLAVLDTDELQLKRAEAVANLAVERAQLSQLQINVEKEKIALQQLQRGTRKETLDIAQKKVNQAQTTYDNAVIAFQDTEKSTQQSLDALYSNSLPIIEKALVSAKSSMLVATDLQYSYLNSNGIEDSLFAAAKEIAMKSLFDQSSAGKWSEKKISSLQTGLFEEYETLELDETKLGTDTLLQKSSQALGYILDMLNSVTVTTSFSTTEKTNLATEKKTMNDQIALLDAQLESITTQKISNQKDINSARSTRDSAQKNLDVVVGDLNLLLAGTETEQIQKQELAVKEAQAALTKQQAVIGKVQALVSQYDVLIGQSRLIASSGGVVADAQVDPGEVVQAGESKFFIISENKFEVIVDVPEIHISKMEVGQEAQVWFDAFGDEEQFSMSVVSIDTAESIIEGIVTYKVHLEFINPDKRIKSGMTTNVFVETLRKDNVLVVPNEYIIVENDGRTYVKVSHSDTYVLREVVLGQQGDNGSVEITAGLNQEDIVVK